MNIDLMAGIQVVIYDYTESVRARIPKRNHSIRWQKKFRKRYGYKQVPLLRNKIIVQRNGPVEVAYMTTATLKALEKQIDKEKLCKKNIQAKTGLL